MFTGIIQHLGTVIGAHPQPSGVRLHVDTSGWGYAAAPGDSVAVNGCCLTVVERQGSTLAFDVIPQTLSLTTIGALQPGESVNLEHAATPTTLLGGHIVQGHVDGVGLVLGVDDRGGGWRARIEIPAGAAGLVMERGSVAVDGVSLTVAAVGGSRADAPAWPEWFEVALIPVTLQVTTLRSRLAGTRVNIEADCLARMVAARMRA